MVKKTKNTLLIVMLAIVLTLSVCLVGCGKEPSITLNSQAEVNLQLGETSVVDFSTENTDSVTVSVVSGGNDVTSDVYDSASKTFSAKSVGTFDLTITANLKKKSTTKAVKFVVAEASKADLQAALTAADAYLAIDYETSAWTAFNTAKNNAAAVAANAAATKDQVASALTALNNAISGLESNKKAVTRAVLNTTTKAFTFNGITYDYSTHEVASIDAAFDKLIALGNDSAIVLQSQYNAKFAEIIAEMIERLQMDITGDGIYTTFNSTSSAVVKIASEEGATLTYAVKNGDTYGEAVAIEGNTFTVPLTGGEVKEIRVSGVKGDHTNTKDIVVGSTFVSGYFSPSATASSTFDAATGKITNNAFLGWNVNDKAKKFNFDFELSGDFEARFTVKVTEGTGDNQAIGFILDKGSVASAGEFAIRYSFSSAHISGLKFGGGDGASDCGDRLKVGNTNTFVVTRVGNVGTLYLEETDENGVVTRIGEVSGTTLTGAVCLGLNYENVKCEITDIKIKYNDAAALINKTALKAEYNAATKLVSYDYTEATWAALVAARNSAKPVIDAVGKTQAEIDAAYDALKAADTALVAVAVEPATISGAEDEVTFKGVTYKKADYFEDSWTAFVTAVKALPADGLRSAYNNGFDAAAAQLREVLSLEGNYYGDDTVYTTYAPVYNFVAKGGDDSTVFTWTVNGVAVDGVVGKTYNHQATFGTKEVIKVSATIEGTLYERETTIDLEKVTLNSKDGWEKDAFKFYDDGSVRIVKSLGWEPVPNRLWVEDYEFDGSFIVEADVMYFGSYIGGTNVFAIHAGRTNENTDWAMSQGGYAAFLYQNGRLEACGHNADASSTDKVVSADNQFNRTRGETIRVRFQRTVKEDGTATYTAAYIINGEVVSSISSDETDTTKVGRVRIGFNSELLSSHLSNIIISADAVVRTADLGAAIDAANEIVVANYPADTADVKTIETFEAAKALANTYYYKKGNKRMLPEGTTQQDVDGVTAALTAATEAVKALGFRAAADADKPVITAESAAGKKDGEIVFDNQTYLQANTINYDEILAAVNAVTLEGKTVIEYRAAVNAELAKAECVPYEVDLNELLSLDTSAVKTVGVYKQEVFKFVYAPVGEETPVLTINGAAVDMTKEGSNFVYQLAAEKGTIYEISFDNALTEEAHKTVSLTYGNTLLMEARSTVSQHVTITDDSVIMHKQADWPSGDRHKAISGTVISGDKISVTFTQAFGSGHGAEVFGLWMGKAPSMNWDGGIQHGQAIGDDVPVFVIKWNDAKFAIEFGNDKQDKVGMSINKTGKHTFRATREIVRDADGKITDVKYSLEVLDPVSGEDASLVKFERTKKDSYTGPISLKWQFEGLVSTVSDIRVETDGNIFNYGTYFDTIKEAIYVNTDSYTAATAAPFKTALKNAIQAYYYNSASLTQADVAKYETALRDAMEALEYEMEVKEVIVDLSKEQDHNINYYDPRVYNVNLTNVGENNTVTATLDGQPIDVVNNKITFTTDESNSMTELKIEVRNIENILVNTSYVRVIALQLATNHNRVTVNDGVVYNNNWDIGKDDQFKKAYVIGTFSGADTTVTYKTRTFDAKNTNWNHSQFIAFTKADLGYGNENDGRLGVEYNTGLLMGREQGSADAVEMAKEIEYENKDLMKIGEERVLQIKTSHFKTADDKTATKFVLNDITGDVEMEAVGQRLIQERVGIAFQYENVAGAFYGIEVYEIITR